MSLTIAASEIGKFTSPDRARAYVQTMRVKSAVHQVGNTIAGYDNSPSDHNSEPGIVVCTNLFTNMNGNGFSVDALVTFENGKVEPAPAPPAPPPPPPAPANKAWSAFTSWLGSGKSKRRAAPPPAAPPPPPPKKILQSISIESTEAAQTKLLPGAKYDPQVQISMQPNEQGTRYEYKCKTEKMTFTEDRCGNLVIESTNIFPMPPA